MIMKRFRDRVEEVLGVRFARRASDLEHEKHGNHHIDWFDNGYAGVFVQDMQKFKGNPTYTGVTEAIDKPVYDTQVVTSATTSLDFFQVPVGQSSKTVNETSMRQSGILPAPEKFTIKRVGLVFLSAVLADLQYLVWQEVFTLSVNAKIYTQGPAFYFPAGIGLYGSTTANNTSIATLGMPGELGVRSLLYDIPLNPLDPFIANLTMYGGGSAGARAIGALSSLSASTEVKCIMQGPYERAI